MNALEAAVQSAEHYQKVNPADNCVVVTDAQGKVLHFLPAKSFHMTMQVGDIVSSAGSTAECIQTRTRVSKVLPKELYGVIVKAVTIPILENNQLVGTLGLGISMETQQVLHESAQTIAGTAQQVTATTEELASSAAQLAEKFSEIEEGGAHVLADIGKTDAILRFVTEVSANSNLLGLNAAIEAARAGEHGRGFSVVAEEIRKMAQNSAQAVSDIKKILSTIELQTKQMVSTVKSTAELGERQASASEQLAAAMQQLAASATDVEKVSQIV